MTSPTKAPLVIVEREDAEFIQLHSNPSVVSVSSTSTSDETTQVNHSPITDSADSQAQLQPKTNEVRIFFSTFLTIFLAELGDKTQVATLLMSAESQSPWIVFAGASLALVATSVLGVSLGCWLSKRVSQTTIKTAAASILLLVSVLLLWDVVRS